MDQAEVLNVIRDTRALISEGAMEGFNPLRGDWAERLFANQAKLTDTIKKLEKA